MADEPLSRALKIVGGNTKLAIELGISQPAVAQWARVPAKHVGKVAALTGIPPHELRPDLFPMAAA